MEIQWILWKASVKAVVTLVRARQLEYGGRGPRQPRTRVLGTLPPHTLWKSHLAIAPGVLWFKQE